MSLSLQSRLGPRALTVQEAWKGPVTLSLSRWWNFAAGFSIGGCMQGRVAPYPVQWEWSIRPVQAA
jgi:hypothetical protein